MPRSRSFAASISPATSPPLTRMPAEQRVAREARHRGGKSGIAGSEMPDEPADQRLRPREVEDPVVVCGPCARFDHHGAGDAKRRRQRFVIAGIDRPVKRGVGFRRPRNTLRTGGIVEMRVAVDDSMSADATADGLVASAAAASAADVRMNSRRVAPDARSRGRRDGDRVTASSSRKRGRGGHCPSP